MELIYSQLEEFFIMLLCGLTLSMLFQIYGSLLPGRQKVEKGGIKAKAFIFSCDVVFFAAAGYICCEFWYYSSFGRISIHEWVGLICGIALWQLLFYNKFSKPLGAICAIILLVCYLGI